MTLFTQNQTDFNLSRSAMPERFKGEICVKSEIGRLRSVIIGTPASQIILKEGIPINPTISELQKYNKELPNQEDLFKSFNAFKDILEKLGIEVFITDRISDGSVIGQMYVRDLGCIIDDKFLVGNPFFAQRKEELRGIEPYLEKISSNKIIYLPKECKIEFGDIIHTNNTILVGLSSRTNKTSEKFLKEIYPNKKVITVEVSENLLHLDCGLVVISKDTALIYPDGFKKDPRPILEDLGIKNHIIVTSEEQRMLRTNVLSISPNEVISNKTSKRINSEIEKRGITVYEIPFDAPSSFGGAFRCATLPLFRDPL